MKNLKPRAWGINERKMYYYTDPSNDVLWDVKYDKGVIVANKKTWWNDIIVKDEWEYIEQEVDFMLPIGILDVNGKDIYEGDIVKTKDGKLFEVVYNKEYARYQLGNKRTIMPLDCLEVVGNIYENKEMLK